MPRCNTSKTTKTRIGVIIDDDTLDAFRLAMVEDGLSLSSVLNELMKWYLEKRPKSAQSSS
jgi:hypothetical protein